MIVPAHRGGENWKTYRSCLLMISGNGKKKYYSCVGIHLARVAINTHNGTKKGGKDGSVRKTVAKAGGEIGSTNEAGGLRGGTKFTAASHTARSFSTGLPYPL